MRVILIFRPVVFISLLIGTFLAGLIAGRARQIRSMYENWQSRQNGSTGIRSRPSSDLGKGA